MEKEGLNLKSAWLVEVILVEKHKRHKSKLTLPAKSFKGTLKDLG